MTISSQLIKSGKSFDQDMKRISRLDGEYVDSGWFQSQGAHSGTTMTYPELAEYHATGGGGRVTPRDVLALTSAVYPVSQDAKVIKALSQWLHGKGNHSEEALLDTLGKIQVERIKSLMGSPLLGATESNPNPLVDSGELKDKVSRKTSTSGVVK